jgi:hypothetical protein
MIGENCDFYRINQKQDENYVIQSSWSVKAYNFTFYYISINEIEDWNEWIHEVNAKEIIWIWKELSE